MKNTFPLVGFLLLLVISTACTPFPHRSTQTSHHIPRYSQIPEKPHYIPPPIRQQPQYSPPANSSSARQTRQSIVNLAYQQVGTRYKYGGSSPRAGFDCSGLMNYLHKKGAGINIPRTAGQQRSKSHTVQYADLKPGDMLFFKTGSSTNHVGVYIGNRQFIHAPNRRSKVKITPMDNSYWHSKFVKFGTFLET